MRILLNIIWLIFGGFISALGFWIAGVVWCITVVGIPIGLQIFKISSIALNPFGKEIIDEGGTGSFLLNILWVVFFGFELALANAIIGLILCITIIGIPFGKQFFKIAKVALMPFVLRVVRTNYL